MLNFDLLNLLDVFFNLFKLVHICELAKAAEMSPIAKIFPRVHQQHAIVRKEHKHHKVKFISNHILLLIFWIKWNRERH